MAPTSGCQKINDKKADIRTGCWHLKYCTSLVILFRRVIQYYLFHVYKIICLKSIILKTPVLRAVFFTVRILIFLNSKRYSRDSLPSGLLLFSSPFFVI
jgi:hypothetical protein